MPQNGATNQSLSAKFIELQRLIELGRLDRFDAEAEVFGNLVAYARIDQTAKANWQDKLKKLRSSANKNCLIKKNQNAEKLSLEITRLQFDHIDPDADPENPVYDISAFRSHADRIKSMLRNFSLPGNEAVRLQKHFDSVVSEANKAPARVAPANETKLGFTFAELQKEIAGYRKMAENGNGSLAMRRLKCVEFKIVKSTLLSLNQTEQLIESLTQAYSIAQKKL